MINVRRTLAVLAATGAVMIGGAGLANAAPAADPVNPLSAQCTAQLTEFATGRTLQFGQGLMNAAVACVDDRMDTGVVLDYAASKIPGGTHGAFELVTKSLIG